MSIILGACDRNSTTQQTDCLQKLIFELTLLFVPCLFIELFLLFTGEVCLSLLTIWEKLTKKVWPPLKKKIEDVAIYIPRWWYLINLPTISLSLSLWYVLSEIWADIVYSCGKISTMVSWVVEFLTRASKIRDISR